MDGNIGGSFIFLPKQFSVDILKKLIAENVHFFRKKKL